MIPLLSILLMIIFSLLGLVHVYWALGNRAGWQAGRLSSPKSMANQPFAHLR